MNRKFLIVITCAVVVATLSSLTPGGDVPTSSGAPIGATNAPGEQTCGKSGCHTGNNNINTGNGKLLIRSLQDITNYLPGQTYDITVSLEEQGVQRFGFSLTVLDEYNNKAGTLMVTEQLRTQIFNGGREFIDREYITYRMVGTNPYADGKGLWTFKWKAPDHYVGKVTFYAGGISANNDATDKGDLVYTASMASGERYASVDEYAGVNNVRVYPNPAKEYIYVESPATGSMATMELYNAAGTKVAAMQSAEGKVRIPVAGVPAGVYQLKVTKGDATATHRVLLMN